MTTISITIIIDYGDALSYMFARYKKTFLFDLFL